MKFVRHHRVISAPKLKEREEAINLRERGLTYSEILKKVPVAKSTLSVWLGSVGLTKKQEQRITEKRLQAARRGSMVRHKQRVERTEKVVADARERVGRLSERELWLVGVALYWAEGSKQHAHAPSVGVIFGNSDVRMLQIFLRWLQQENVQMQDINFELYVHTTRRGEVDSFKSWWAGELTILPSAIGRVYYKKGNRTTQRANVGRLYHGLLRIKVNRSTSLNRSIIGAIEGIVG